MEDATEAAGFHAGWTDTDSAIDGISSPTSDTTSIDSGLYIHVEKHGRKYHGYRAGKYLLPNDNPELVRLTLQHELFFLTLDGKLHLAPISRESQWVLDIGTGTGIWAIEFAQQYPSTRVIGTDLSPIQPIDVPRNCRFEVDDVEDEWTYTNKFDYVHGRLLFSCFIDSASVINKAFVALNPGGYLELQDSLPLTCLDGSWNGKAIQRWIDLVLEGARNLGMDWAKVGRYKQWMEDAGFVDIQEESFEWPSSTWPKGKHHKLLGKLANKNISMGLHGVSIEVLTAGCGMSPAEVESLLEDVKKDLCDRATHCYAPIRVIYGRKPEMRLSKSMEYSKASSMKVVGVQKLGALGST